MKPNWTVTSGPNGVKVSDANKGLPFGESWKGFTSKKVAKEFAGRLVDSGGIGMRAPDSRSSEPVRRTP